MKVKPDTTVAELMGRYPNGFAVGPGTSNNPGELSRIIAATSHLYMIEQRYPFPEGNQGYMVVDMDEAEAAV